MSVVFIVVPAVAASWPLLCGAAAAAAGAIGYKTLNAANQTSDSTEQQTTSVEVTLEGSDILGESMKRDSEFVLTNGDVQATFRRSADGRCTVHVAGENRTQEELSAIGRDLLGRVTQQYAYNKVLSDLKQQGFTVTNEEVSEDQTIRVRVSRYA